MKSISRRLFKLEKMLAPAVESETGWGEMARVRDELLLLARQNGTRPVAQLEQELDAIGPTGLWLETVRIYLREHGFAQGTSESLAVTVARALGIDMLGLKVCIEQGRLGAALLERFEQPGTATDNG
jgi:hypothetical protein